MTDIPVSVIVVSRHRPTSLIRCLTGISQLRYAPFEVVVVADPEGLQAVRSLPFADSLKTVSCDEPNISAARNLGLANAGGEVVAFIDDDAVPEPGWLRHLIGPFVDPAVASGTGFVRGRNGISWQWRSSMVDDAGVSQPLEVSGTTPAVLKPADDRAIKTEGTNMAFRRSVLETVGGFDPNYRYFLDETDLNLRLAGRGFSTAVVPLAAVHHGHQENASRRADRVPRDLTEIGASWAVFLSQHYSGDIKTRWIAIQDAERQRLVRHMVNGLLEPRDVRKIMKGLRDGYEKGLVRAPSIMAPLRAANVPFRAFPSDPDREIIPLAGRSWSKRKLLKQAETAAATGAIPCVSVFSPTTLYHRRWYDARGFWVQTGGLFGKSLRTDRLFAWWRFRDRVKREAGLWEEYQ